MIRIRRRSERGQSFVELALSIVFLLVLLSATIDLGWAFYTMITLRDAVQEAAAYGAICAFDSTNTAANTALIKQRLLLSVPEPIDMKDIPSSDIVVEFTKKDGTAAVVPEMGGSVIVRATIQHQILTPFVGTFIGTNQYPLTVEIAHTVMRSKWLTQCDYE